MMYHEKPRQRKVPLASLLLAVPVVAVAAAAGQVSRDMDAQAAAAEKVADTRTFTVVQDGARYIITTDDGEVHVTLHSAGRADE